MMRVMFLNIGACSDPRSQDLSSLAALLENNSESTDPVDSIAEAEKLYES